MTFLKITEITITESLTASFAGLFAGKLLKTSYPIVLVSRRGEMRHRDRVLADDIFVLE